MTRRREWPLVRKYKIEATDLINNLFFRFLLFSSLQGPVAPVAELR